MASEGARSYIRRVGGPSLRYPDDFVEKVKFEYKDRPGICDLAEQGSLVLGQYLAADVNLHMSPEQIVDLFKCGLESSVLLAAESAVRRRQIHAEWIKLVAEKITKLDTPPGDVAAISRVK